MASHRSETKHLLVYFQDLIYGLVGRRSTSFLRSMGRLPKSAMSKLEDHMKNVLYNETCFFLNSVRLSMYFLVFMHYCLWFSFHT